MRVYSPTSTNCFAKSIKKQINLMQRNNNNIEKEGEQQQQQQQQHQKQKQKYHHADRELWSLPIKCCYFFAFILVTLFLQHKFIAAAAYEGRTSGTLDDVTKGLKGRMRSPKIASIHILQAVPESLPKNRHASAGDPDDGKPVAAAISAADNHTTAPSAGKFEIRTVSGEPSYKSVNLTWEVEFVTTDNDAITNTSREVEPPTSFQVFFCEIQSFGPHRCRSKVINGSTSPQIYESLDNDLDAADQIRQVRQYTTQVENLRMATKYSFHIRATPKHRNLKVTGRSELFGNEIEGEDFLSTNIGHGQTIVVPTKGFSAQATRCLPTASEIEVETGPYFGGKIVVDGGNCGIKGDPSDAKDKYIMRIDHKICGSMVKPETNTVETFITVQENLGIFTHSTRRFVVVCSYQSGLQTVRASFSVPGRGGASAVHSDHDGREEEERMGRGLKPMRYVDKSALILKESEATEDNVASEETMATVEQMDNPTINYNSSATNAWAANDATSAVAALESSLAGENEERIKKTEVEKTNNDQHKETEIKYNGENDKNISNANSLTTTSVGDLNGGDYESTAAGLEDNHDAHENFSARYDKLTLQLSDRPSNALKHDGAEFGTTPTGRGFSSGTEIITFNMGSALLTVFLSVLLIGVFIYVLYRETNLPPSLTTSSTPSDISYRFRQHKQLQEVDTLPRSTKTKNQNTQA